MLSSVIAIAETEYMVALDNWVSNMKAQRENDFGYPCDQQLALADFYQWYVESGMSTMVLNNAGDPFQPSPHISSIGFEEEVLRFFGPKFGFTAEELWGLVTFSGTDSNNHGIYFGANYLRSLTGMEPIVYVSTEAHYSNMRLVDLQGLELRLIDTDETGAMIPEKLAEAIDPSRPVLIVFAMGTTFKGGVDNQAVLNQIIAEKSPVAVYRHVDAALFGGYLPFTDRKDLVDRTVQPYDSIAISAHKFIGLDEPAGIFLTTREVLERQKSYDVPYLNSGMPMISCSRNGLIPLKLWWMIQHDGEEHWTAEAKEVLENTEYLCEELERAGITFWVNDASNTVFFAKPSAEFVHKYDLATDHDDRLGGDLAHIVVMQHVSKDKIQIFVNELKQEYEELNEAA